jgi:hypothetical protein
MDEILVVGLVLLAGGVFAIGGVIAYEFVWKPRRQRRLERAHFRSKRD